jgi:endonuclease YncB( thermonuclease family)
MRLTSLLIGLGLMLLYLPSVATAADWMKECGAEWRDYKSKHGKPQSGEGREAWAEFLRSCIQQKRQGRTTRLIKDDVRVVDGDTVDVNGTRMRFRDCDTPELANAACDAERELGEKAAERLRKLLRTGEIRMHERSGRDFYNRPLIELSVDGESVCSVLIKERLAVPYKRKHPRKSWCSRGSKR